VPELDVSALPRPALPRVELAYEAVVDIGELVSLGQSPLGERRIIDIVGGEFSGPGLRGKVLRGGADRQLVRPDGLRLLDALYEMQTDDGTILTVHNKCKVRDAGPGHARYAFSTLEVTAPQGRYDWLNQLVLVGTVTPLMPQRRAVLISVYKLL